MRKNIYFSQDLTEKGSYNYYKHRCSSKNLILRIIMTYVTIQLQSRVHYLVFFHKPKKR